MWHVWPKWDTLIAALLTTVSFSLEAGRRRFARWHARAAAVSRLGLPGGIEERVLPKPALPALEWTHTSGEACAGVRPSYSRILLDSSAQFCHDGHRAFNEHWNVDILQSISTSIPLDLDRHRYRRRSNRCAL